MLCDRGRHLFVDDGEVQDRPGFVRKVQQPARVRREPVLEPERPELGLIEFQGSKANNIVLETRGDPWGVFRVGRRGARNVRGAFAGWDSLDV